MIPSTCHFADPGTNRGRGYLEHVPFGDRALAKKPNYNLEKNRREQDRKKKKEEKRLRKLENSRNDSAEPSENDPDGGAEPPAES
jgi:hypothetical protein